MNKVRRTASFLARLSEADYPALPRSMSDLVNYAVDSWIFKIQSMKKPDATVYPPADPSSHVKEKWLECEIHKCVTVNRSYPSFAKSLNAHSFAMLFDPYGGELASYKVVPFLDSYEWKDLVKGSYEWRLQQETVRTNPSNSVTLPVYGTFFVESKSTGSKLIVKIDLCYEGSGCNFTVMSSPSSKGACERFLSELDASRQANDIYYRQCLTFVREHLDFCDVTPTKWDDIVLKKQVKDAIQENTVGVLSNVEVLQKIGMTPSRNVMLISPPGMAKTTIFRAITSDVSGRMTVIWCTGKSIETSSDVTSLFEAARSLSPCIIFIEDMDLFGQDRTSGSFGFDNHILNEFLACLDGSQENSGVVVMASTNDIASMDEALVNRPGRFDVKVDMPYPDAEDRYKMLQSFLESYKASPDKSVTRDTVKNLVNLTDGLTGAYIKDLVKAAVIRAVKNGQASHDCSFVSLSADDLTLAAEQVLKNFEIGKKAKKHHQTHHQSDV